MKSRYILGLLLIVLSYTSSYARHLLGGSAAYQVTNQNELNSTVNFEFNLFRDNLSGGANFDGNARFGVYGVKNGVNTFLQEVTTSFGNVQNITQTNPGDCPLYEYSSATYSFSVTFPNFSYDYYVIAHQRCCRPGIISNIMIPEESGFALSVTLYPSAFSYFEKANAIPSSSIPFLVRSHDEDIVDLDTDDIYTKEYSLTTPANAGGVAGVNFGDPESCEGITPNPENCPPPFAMVQYVDENNPYGMDSEVSIDKELGELSVYIPSNGITLFETTLKRYIDGILLSSTNTQWTTISAMCTFGPVSVNDDSEYNEIVLAPNPASSTIYSSNLLSDVTIIDVLGRKVKAIKSMKAKEEISIVDFTAGVYRLTGTNENGDVVTLQFVKSIR